MRKIHSRWVALALVAIGPAAAAHDRSGQSADHNRPAFVFNSFDVPGAVMTSANGVNSHGDIAGNFRDASGKTHGYLMTNGAFTTFDYPGAVYTDARGINARGEIVGAYRRPGERPVDFHGYLRTRDGDFTQVDFPGHINTIPQRILASGLILGCRHDDEFMDSMRGVTINGRDQSEYTEIDAFGSMHNGATPDGGVIVGFDTNIDTGRRRGYLLYGDTFVSFVVPGSTFTEAWDISPRGVVVGTYQDATKIHGFVWEKLRFNTVDYPAATTTRTFGINARGDIVGSFVDAAGRTHGYLARRPRGHDR